MSPPTIADPRRQRALPTPAPLFLWMLLVNSWLCLRGVPADVRAARYHQPRFGNLDFWRHWQNWVRLFVLCLPYFVGGWIYYMLRWGNNNNHPYDVNHQDCPSELLARAAPTCPARA
jgi:hypothetical protein